MTKRIAVGLASLTLTLASASAIGAQGAGSAPKAPSSSPDVAFMQQLAVGGMTEVQLGQLAMQNASSTEVKQFGQKMVTDHGRSGEELKELAAKQKVTLPTALDHEHHMKVEELRVLKGQAFDRAYMSHMVPAHEQTVALIQKEIQTGAEADTKAFAQKILPTVQEHLRLARDINARVAK